MEIINKTKNANNADRSDKRIPIASSIKRYLLKLKEGGTEAEAIFTVSLSLQNFTLYLFA